MPNQADDANIMETDLYDFLDDGAEQYEKKFRQHPKDLRLLRCARNLRVLADTSIGVPKALLKQVNDLFDRVGETAVGIILALGIGEHRYDEPDFSEWSSATHFMRDLLFELTAFERNPDRPCGECWSSRSKRL